MRPFWRRSEFWGCLGVCVLGVVYALGHISEAQVDRLGGALIALLSALGYAFGRSYVKAKRPVPSAKDGDVTQVLQTLLQALVPPRVEVSTKPAASETPKVVVTDEEASALFEDTAEKPIIKSNKEKK